jgi:flagellar biogenesis protein FliO
VIQIPKSETKMNWVRFPNRELREIRGKGAPASAADSADSAVPFRLFRFWPGEFGISYFAFRILAIALLLAPFIGSAETTNSDATLLLPPSLPSAGPSLLRVLGALALVLGLFLGGVWLFRNGRQLAFRRGRSPRLNVLESRSLGGRHALYVIAYEQERFLLASTPAGINLLSHLSPAVEDECETSRQPARVPSFAQALAKVFKGQSTPSAKTEAPK